MAFSATSATSCVVELARTVVAMEVETAQGSYMSELAPRLMAQFRARDVLLRPLGNTLYVMPPYCISDADLAL